VKLYFNISGEHLRLLAGRPRWAEVLVLELYMPSSRIIKRGGQPPGARTDQEFEKLLVDVIAHNQSQIVFTKFDANLPLLCKLVRANIQKSLMLDPVLNKPIPSNQEQYAEYELEIQQWKDRLSTWLPYTEAEYNFIETSNFFINNEGQWWIAEDVVLQAALTYLDKKGISPFSYLAFSALRDQVDVHVVVAFICK